MKNLLLLFIILASWSTIAFSRPDSLFQQYEQATQPSKKVRLLLRISDDYYNIDLDSFKFYSYQALDLYHTLSLNNDTLSNIIHKNIGEYYTLTNDTTQAFSFFRKALRACEGSNLQLHKANLFTAIGSAYWHSDVYDKGVTYFFKSLHLYEELEHKTGIANTYNNIASLFADLKRFKKAIYYYDKAGQLHLEANDMLGYAIVQYNIGDINVDQEKYDAAQEYTLKALKLSDSLDDKYGVLLAKVSLGIIYKEKGKYELALQEAQEAHDMAKKLGYTRELSYTSLTLAQIHQHEKAYAASLRLGQEALDLAQYFNSIREKSQVYQCLAKSYHAVGLDSEAYRYLALYEKARDSFIMQEKGLIAAELDIRYQTEKKGVENRYLKSQVKKDALIIKQQSYISTAIAVGLVLLFFLALSLYRKNQQKHRYNQVLEKKVKERTLHLQTANQQLKRVNAELESFAYIASHDLKEPLRNIASFAGLMERCIARGDYQQLEEYLAFITKNTRQMRDLIRDVLDFTKINHHSKEDKVDRLANMVEKASVDLQVLLREKNGQIIFESDNWQTQTLNITLPQQVSLVVKNLIENGIKYNEKSTPTVRVSYSQDQNEHILCFQDNGIGIAPEYHEKVFEMFKRLNNRSEYEGSGMGLAICRKIIRALGGDLKLTSMEGYGTTFECRIPVSNNEAVIAHQQENVEA